MTRGTRTALNVEHGLYSSFALIVDLHSDSDLDRYGRHCTGGQVHG